MSTARQRAEAAFGEVTNATAGAALKAHQHAMQRWLAAPLAERPHYWRAVETAWRKIKQLGLTSEAQFAATNLALNHNKLRSNK